MPKVSVIIPHYNRAEYLKRAIASALRQTFHDMDIWVVQNGASKNAEEFVLELNRESKIPIHYLHDSTPSAAVGRNVGVAHARGEYIAFLDDDDEWLPEKIEKQSKALDQDPDLGIVFSTAVIVDNKGNSLAIKQVIYPYPDLEYFMTQGCIIRSLSGVMVRRSICEKVGPQNPSYRICTDYDFFIRAAKVTRYLQIEEPLYRYVCHSQNLSGDSKAMYLESISILKKNFLETPELIPKEWVNQGVRFFSRRLYACGADALDQKNYGVAASYFFTAIQYDPFIGSRVKWGRYQSPIYRFLRPYIAAGYCAFKSWLVTNKTSSGVNRV